MAGPKRRFVTPLSAGRSVSLGANDPRARRDNPARSVGVPDPSLTTAQVQTLIDTAIAESVAPVTPVAPESGTDSPGGGTLDQGTAWPDPPNEHFYVVFGVDGAWEAIQFAPTTGDATTGSGQTGPRPTSLPTLRGLTYS